MTEPGQAGHIRTYELPAGSGAATGCSTAPAYDPCPIDSVVPFGRRTSILTSPFAGVHTVMRSHDDAHDVRIADAAEALALLERHPRHSTGGAPAWPGTIGPSGPAGTGGSPFGMVGETAPGKAHGHRDHDGGQQVSSRTIHARMVRGYGPPAACKPGRGPLPCCIGSSSTMTAQQARAIERAT